MIVANLASLLTIGFHFGGGNMLDLSKAILAFTHKPAFVSSFTPLPQASLDLKDVTFLRNNFHKLIAPKVGLRSNTKEDGAFQPTALAPYYFRDVSSKNGMPAYIAANPTTALDKLTVANGIVSSKEGSGLLPLKDLSQLRFSKPVSVHWFLQEYRVAFALSSCDEATFLSGLAKATCGRLVVTKSGFSIETDPESFRRQWIGRLQRQKAGTPVDLRKERFQMSIEQLQNLSKAQLDKVLEKPGGWAHYQVDEKSLLVRRVITYLNSYLEYCAQHKNDVECYIFRTSILSEGGIDLSNGLRVQISYPEIEFLVDKKNQLSGKPRSIVGF